MRAGAARTAAARAAVLGSVAAAVLVAGAGPAAACSPPDEAEFNEVVAPARAAGTADQTYVGVVERRVVAHAPMVPILTTRRSVAVASRTWGDVSGVELPDRRHGGYFSHLLTFVSFCPAAPAPRTGDVTMTAVVERADGTARSMWMAEERYRFDPTFPDGLTGEQDAALAARFGPPQVLPAPGPVSLLGWWLWAWLPWLVIGGVAALGVMGVRRVRRRRAQQA